MPNRFDDDPTNPPTPPDQPAPPGPPPKSPQQRWMMALAVGLPILRQVGGVIAQVLKPEPRTCPKCSYRMVDEVFRPRAKRGAARVGYWRCSACAARYKTLEKEGPFHAASDEDWFRSVPIRFPR